jgi:hypothetical protein
MTRPKCQVGEGDVSSHSGWRITSRASPVSIGRFLTAPSAVARGVRSRDRSQLHRAFATRPSTGSVILLRGIIRLDGAFTEGFREGAASYKEVLRDLTHHIRAV